MPFGREHAVAAARAGPPTRVVANRLIIRQPAR